VRFALALLAVLALVTSSACGDEDEAAPTEPVSLEQRVVTAEDAPGSKPDPVETRQTTTDFDEFIDVLGQLAVDPDTEEMTDVFTEVGFEGAIVDTRFFGETHSPDHPHIVSSVIQLQSEEGAASALEWLEADSMKPCPRTCAVQISEFDVEGVPDGWGVHRSQSAEDIEAVGTEGDRPFDSYAIGFTDGSFVYTLDLHGPPGSVSEEEALAIAHALHQRIADLPS
jgi:hypothetical protein